MEQQITEKKPFPKRIIVISVISFMVVIMAVLAVVFKPWELPKTEEEAEEMENPTITMFVCDENDEDYGRLYLKSMDGIETEIASNVYRYSIHYLKQSGILTFTDKDHSLYVKENGKAIEKLADYGNIDAISKSEDVFTYYNQGSGDDENADLYIRHANGSKEKVAAQIPPYYDTQLNDDGTVLYYRDNDCAVNKWTKETGKEKIFTRSSGFLAENSGAYARWKGGDVYIKLANQTDHQKMGSSDKLRDIVFSSDGFFAIFCDDITFHEAKKESETGQNIGKLYIYLEADTRLKIDSDVVDFKLSENNEYVYYKNADGDLYRKAIPKITEKTIQNAEKYTKKFKEQEKSKIGTDVKSFEISPNGKNAVYLNNDNALYVSVGENRGVKIANEASSPKIHNNRLVYLGPKNKLYLNNKLSDEKTIAENCVIIGENVTSYSASKQLKYIIFNEKAKNEVRVCIDGVVQKTPMLPQTNAYDIVWYNYNVIHENLLSLSYLAGNYYIADMDLYFSLSEDGEFIFYDKNGTDIKQKFNTLYSSKSGIMLNLKESYDGETCEYLYNDNTIYIKVNDGVIYVSNYKYATSEYIMTPMDSESFAEKIQIQREEEAKRIALEKKINEMKEKGKLYLKNGISLTTKSTLYSSASTDSPVDAHFAEDGEVSVNSYQVSEDGNTLWLELRARYKGKNVWVPVN